MLKWVDTLDIAIELAEKYPEKVEEIKLIAQNHINSFNPPKSLLESRKSEKF